RSQVVAMPTSDTCASGPGGYNLKDVAWSGGFQDRDQGARGGWMGAEGSEGESSPVQASNEEGEDHGAASQEGPRHQRRQVHRKAGRDSPSPRGAKLMRYPA